MRHLIKLLFIHANQGQCANSLDGKRKGQIEAELEVFLAENAANLSDDPALSGYYNTRRFGAMSPVKREFSQGRTPRRRVTMTQVVSTIEPADAEQPIEESPESSIEYVIAFLRSSMRRVASRKIFSIFGLELAELTQILERNPRLPLHL